MSRAQRQRVATAADARVRLRSAEAYLDVADLILDERDRAEMPGVAASLAVLTGIASSDAICARRLGAISRGEDHRAAATLLKEATPDGARLAAVFPRLVDVKDEAHYGLVLVVHRKARDAVRWARELTNRAREEVEC